MDYDAYFEGYAHKYADRADAPNYKSADTLSNKNCATCAFLNVNTGMCEQYNFKVNPDWVCDTYQSGSGEGVAGEVFSKAAAPEDTVLSLSRKAGFTIPAAAKQKERSRRNVLARKRIAAIQALGKKYMKQMDPAVFGPGQYHYPADIAFKKVQEGLKEKGLHTYKQGALEDFKDKWTKRTHFMRGKAAALAVDSANPSPTTYSMNPPQNPDPAYKAADYQEITKKRTKIPKTEATTSGQAVSHRNVTSGEPAASTTSYVQNSSPFAPK